MAKTSSHARYKSGEPALDWYNAQRTKENPDWWCPLLPNEELMQLLIAVNSTTRVTDIKGREILPSGKWKIIIKRRSSDSLPD